MPLLDLKTDLKSLRYTGDQPGGGWSGKPYIQTALPNDLMKSPVGVGIVNLDNRGLLTGIDPIYRIQSTGNLDYPIRGGDVKFNIGTQTFTLSSQIDKTRIKRFFEDKPRGTAFLQKQIGLNLTNPKVETGNSFQAVPNSNIIPGLIENTRIYNNGINTLAQVGVQGTGTHLPRHGVFPLDYLSKYYSDIVGAQNTNNDASTNRLLILQNLKLNTNSASTSTNPNIVNKLGISYNRNVLFQYLGGPGSTYGIGTTVIKRTDDTSRAVTKYGSISGMTYDQIIGQSLNNTTQGRRTTKIQDYRTSTEIPSREAYYNLTVSGSADRLQAMNAMLFGNSIAPWEVNEKETKDIIKFVFEAIENNNPANSWAIFFRAMLSGFQDNHQASINAFKYIGRGEDFYTYQGVSRNISFSFKIGVGSKEELRPIYAKLNHLISQCYPDYSQRFGIMRAPVVRLTIGDYLYRVAGMIESVNVTIDDNSPWDINLDENGNLANRRQLPQVINVSVTFKPIQDFLPRRANAENLNVPYMTNYEEDYVSLAGYDRFGTYESVTTNRRATSDAISPVVESSRNAQLETNPFGSQIRAAIQSGNILNFGENLRNLVG